MSLGSDNWWDQLLAPGAVIGIIVIVIGWLWKFSDNKRQRTKDATDLASKTEDKAIAKGIVERNQAKDLAEGVRQEKQTTKEETENYTDRAIATAEFEQQLRSQILSSNLDSRDVNVKQLRKDFEDYEKMTREKLALIAKRIDRLDSMQFGSDAKSEPAYMKGKEETQRHKDEPGKGMFYQQSDEEQDQQTKDNEERLKKEKETEGDAL